MMDAETHSDLDGVREFITRYVATTDVQADVLTLWCAHTHAFEAAETTPYLRITSVGPGAGKTRLLEVLELLVASPFLTGRLTGPALARLVDRDHPTLLLDETDSIFTGGPASQQMLRGLLNTGYRLGGKVAYARGSGIQELMTFCPKAFAGIGGLPSTIEDRSIPIVLKRRTVFQPIERLRQRDVKQEARVPRMVAARFAATHLDMLARARPEIPSQLDDRAADVWEPLLAIADAVGGSWPERARAAAVQLCAARRESDTETVAFRLLKACVDVFEELGAPRLKTQTLLETLRADGWEDVEGRPLDARLLALLLSGFGVAPQKLRFGKVALQGYDRRSMDRAWAAIMPEPRIEALA